MKRNTTKRRATDPSKVVQMPRPKDQQGVARPVPLDRSIVTAATDINDQKKTFDLAKRYAQSSFDLQYGAELAEAEAAEALVTKLHADTDAELDDTNKKLKAEPPLIPVSKAKGGLHGAAETESNAIWHWPMRDMFAGFLCLTALIGLLCASYAGIHATLADAGLPIFDGQKHLPFMLAVLAPAAGILIKSAVGVFNDSANKDRYRKVVTAAGILAFFAWVPMFASLFEGLSGVFDPFKEANYLLAWGFNVGHVLAEALISAALFFQLDALPSRLIPNDARPPLEKQRDKLIEKLEALTNRLGTARGRVRSLRALSAEVDVLVEAAILQRIKRQSESGLL